MIGIQRIRVEVGKPKHKKALGMEASQRAKNTPENTLIMLLINYLSSWTLNFHSSN